MCQKNELWSLRYKLKMLLLHLKMFVAFLILMMQ